MVKRSTEQWLDLFKQHNESGLTAAQFCRDKELCPRYFSKRKRDLGWKAIPSFKPKLVKLTKPKPSRYLQPVTLQFGEAKLNIDGGVSPQWLAQVMKALV
jgi:hypothetical protein